MECRWHAWQGCLATYNFIGSKHDYTAHDWLELTFIGGLHVLENVAWTQDQSEGNVCSHNACVWLTSFDMQWTFLATLPDSASGLHKIGWPMEKLNESCGAMLYFMVARFSRSRMTWLPRHAASPAVFVLWYQKLGFYTKQIRLHVFFINLYISFWALHGKARRCECIPQMSWAPCLWRPRPVACPLSKKSTF
jgi:hypothetical protein